MTSRAVSRCLVFLENTEGLCRETDLLRERIENTQSAIAMELYAWHELMADLERCLAHAKKVARAD